jgi:hypothetical protein
MCDRSITELIVSAPKVSDIENVVFGCDPAFPRPTPVWVELSREESAATMDRVGRQAQGEGGYEQPAQTSGTFGTHAGAISENFSAIERTSGTFGTHAGAISENFLSLTWPQPEPLGSELPAVPEFDPEMLPTALRALVVDVAERMQTPTDFPGIVAVATLAGMVNRRAIVQPKRDDTSWVVVPNLWGAIVAPPGAMKSPVLACMTRPARLIEAEWRAKNEAALEDFAGQEERSKLDLSVWSENYKRARKAGNEAPVKPEFTTLQPTPKRLITTDATFESLQKLLSENPAGLFMLRDELTGWLAGLDRQGREQERGFALEAWNGDSGFTIDRIGRGTVHVEHACLSLFGGIQPGRLRAYLADALRDGPSNDGLMQRNGSTSIGLQTSEPLA